MAWPDGVGPHARTYQWYAWPAELSGSAESWSWVDELPVARDSSVNAVLVVTIGIFGLSTEVVNLSSCPR